MLLLDVESHSWVTMIHDPVRSGDQKHDEPIAVFGAEHLHAGVIELQRLQVSLGVCFGGKSLAKVSWNGRERLEACWAL